MSMSAPEYMKDENYEKWYDKENCCFREGTPQEFLDRVRKEDEERDREYEEALKQGILL